MTDSVANNNSAPRFTGFRLNKYSFIVQDFTPSSDAYPFEVKNNKVYVNLTTYEQRQAFFAELKEKNIRARETLYEYFVPVSHQLDGQTVTFQTIVAYLRNVVESNDTTKELRRCFKVVNDNTNFKVVVSSYALASILNTTRVFFPYRRRNNGDRANNSATEGDAANGTQRPPRFQRPQHSQRSHQNDESTVTVGDVVSYASSQNASTRTYANAVSGSNGQRDSRGFRGGQRDSSGVRGGQRGVRGGRGGRGGQRGPRVPRQPASEAPQAPQASEASEASAATPATPEVEAASN